MAYKDVDGNDVDGNGRSIELEEHLWTKEPPWTCPMCGWVNLGIRERCRNFDCDFDSALVSGDCYFPVENTDALERDYPGCLEDKRDA